MKNFCIFCGKRQVSDSCNCSEYIAYFGASYVNDVPETINVEEAECYSDGSETETVYAGAGSVSKIPSTSAASATRSTPLTSSKKTSDSPWFNSAGDL